jgi:hypothetical protein
MPRREAYARGMRLTGVDFREDPSKAMIKKASS